MNHPNARATHDREPDLTPEERRFWDQHSGIAASEEEVERAIAANAAAQEAADAAALGVEEVARRLNMPVAAVQRDASARRLYTYTVGGRTVFPDWQFAGERTIPYLPDVLQALPVDLHPGAVAGFFLSPQPDLVLGDRPASIREWLLAGRDISPVVRQAEELDTGY